MVYTATNHIERGAHFGAERKTPSLRPASPDPDYAGGGISEQKDSFTLPGGGFFIAKQARVYLRKW